MVLPRVPVRTQGQGLSATRHCHGWLGCLYQGDCQSLSSCKTCIVPVSPDSFRVSPDEKIKFFDASVCKALKTLFHTDDPRTVRRRIATLKDTLSSLEKTWVIEGLLAKLEQVMPAIGNPGRWPSTSNAAEWFFRDDERLTYLPKGPFADIESARKLTGLCVLGYVFRMGLKGQACPLERAQVDVSRIPLY